MSIKKNEGEGSKTAAKQYNDAAGKFARSGSVPEQAEKAAHALDGEEHDALEEAEAEGKRHAAEEDRLLHDPDEVAVDAMGDTEKYDIDNKKS